MFQLLRFSDARELAKSKNLDVYSNLEDNVFEKHYDYGIISNWTRSC